MFTLTINYSSLWMNVIKKILNFQYSLYIWIEYYSMAITELYLYGWKINNEKQTNKQRKKEITKINNLK